MMKIIISATGLVAAASAFTPPVQPPTYGSLLTPDLTTPVTTGQTFEVKWTPKQPADGVTVSLVLCNGPSTNCVLQSTAIVEGISAASGLYSWNVPCSLPAGVQATDSGYGMLIIVDGTGEFQYSTQFSVQKGASCASSSSTISSSSSSPRSSSSSVSSSASASSSASGAPTSSTTSSIWYGWSSTGFNTTTVPTYTASSRISTTAAAVTASASASYTYVRSSSSAAATTAAATSARPSTFTGGAAMPSAFVNVAGLAAAGLAILVL